MFIDTHAHLDKSFFSEDEEQKELQDSLSSLELVIHISLDSQEFKINYPKLNHLENVAFATGLYPDQANIANQNWEHSLTELKSILTNYKHVALGEIGIDLKHEHYGALEDQSILFRKQLELAEELNLPVIIHSRESFDECYEVLKDFPELTVIFHCFSYGQREADLILEKDNYLSFSGILTYKKSTELQELAKTIPLDRIFFETDAPYLAPVPFRGKANYPQYVEHTYRYFAHLRDIPLEELSLQVRENVHRAFKLD
ncbi:MAG: TatD family hydrolase [Brevinema sp.]